MASGTNTRQRRGQILVRLTDEELAVADDKADRAGLTRAAFVRAAIVGSPGPRAQRRPPADHVALRKLLGELGRVGNNINQIARTLNSGEDADIPELREALQAYLQLRDAIFDALGMEPSGDNQGRE